MQLKLPIWDFHLRRLHIQSFKIYYFPEGGNDQFCHMMK